MKCHRIPSSWKKGGRNRNDSLLYKIDSIIFKTEIQSETQNSYSYRLMYVDELRMNKMIQ